MLHPTIVRLPEDYAARASDGSFINPHKDIPKLIYHVQEDKWEVKGGTAEDNATLAAKHDPTLKEKTGMRVDVADWQDVYREYTDGRLIKKMPGNSFFTGDLDLNSRRKVEKVLRIGEDAFKKYFSGECSAEDIKKAFLDTVTEITNLLYERGQTSGKNPVDNKKIIQDTLFVFRNTGVALGVSACYIEGMGKYAGTNKKGSYYNSDYHYLTEDMLDTIEKTAVELGVSLETEAIDINEWKLGAPSLNELMQSFNSRWSWANGLNANMAEITDFNGEPPKDFEFLFANNGSDYIVEFTIKGKTETVEVPFNLAGGVDQFKLYDIFKQKTEDAEYQKALSWFLNSVSIFTYMGYIGTHDVGFNARA